MKIFLKAFAIAAAFGLAPGIALAQAPPCHRPIRAAGRQSDHARERSGRRERAAPATNAATLAAPPQAAPTAHIGQPDGRYGLPEQVSPIGEEAAWFHDWILFPVITSSRCSCSVCWPG